MIEFKTRGGQTIIVDDEDLDLIHPDSRVKRPNAYVKARSGYLMHLVVMERILGRNLLPGEKVDHKNLNKMDNSRSNLRLATSSQNQANKRKSRFGKNPYKGVQKASRLTWKAAIGVNGKNIHLGTFDTPEEAHEAYKAAAVKYFGEFARFE